MSDNVSGKAILSFFKTADLDMAELVLDMAEKEVKDRQSAKARIVANLKKARAAKTAPGSKAAAPKAKHAANRTPAPPQSRSVNEQDEQADTQEAVATA